MIRDALGEAITELLFSGVTEALIISIIAVLRLPGALIGWAIWRNRIWNQVWSKGDAFGQGLVGLFVHTTWIGLLAASYN